jgi:hypothetical protein
MQSKYAVAVSRTTRGYCVPCRRIGHRIVPSVFMVAMKLSNDRCYWCCFTDCTACTSCCMRCGRDPVMPVLMRIKPGWMPAIGQMQTKSPQAVDESADTR